MIAGALLLALVAAPAQNGIALEELRVLAERDREGELVERGLPAVESGGPLASSGEAVALVAGALASLGREERAEALLTGARPADAEGRAWVALEHARLDLLRDRLDAALGRLGERDGSGLVLHHPDHPESWLLAGRTLARGAERATARPFLERFLELAPLHPEAPSAWYQLELEAIDRRDLERARACRAERERLEEWHRVVAVRRAQKRRHPEAPEPRFGLGLAWMEVERFDEAAAEFEELARLAPDWCRLWFHLGEAQRRRGGDDAALQAFDRGVACDPDDAKSRFNRAELRWRRGERAEARADFETLLGTAAADDPRFAALHLRLGQAAEERGEAAAAERHLARYRELTGAAER